MNWEITLGSTFLMVGMTGCFSAALALSSTKKKLSLRAIEILITQILFLSMVIAGGAFVMRGIR